MTNFLKNVIHIFILLFPCLFLSSNESQKQIDSANQAQDKESKCSLNNETEAFINNNSTSPNINQKETPTKEGSNIFLGQASKNYPGQGFKRNNASKKPSQDKSGDFIVIENNQADEEDPFVDFYPFIIPEQQEEELYIPEETEQTREILPLRILVSSGGSIVFKESNNNKILFSTNGSEVDMQEWNGLPLKMENNQKLLIKGPQGLVVQLIRENGFYSFGTQHPELKLESSVDINLELESLSIDITGRLASISGKLTFLRLRDLQISKNLNIASGSIRLQNVRAAECNLNSGYCDISNLSSKKCTIEAGSCKMDRAFIGDMKLKCGWASISGELGYLNASLGSGEINAFIFGGCTIESPYCSGTLFAKKDINIRFKGAVNGLKIQRIE